MELWIVLVVATITALCTGLGVIPFLFIKVIDRKLVGLGNAIAAGLMMGASIALVIEAARLNINRLLIGVCIGLLIIWLAKIVSPQNKFEEETIQNKTGKIDVRKMLLIMIVMTVHSFAEGIGVGVSFGGREGLGQVISAAIAIHNIPEGLAIGLVMIPRGVSITKAGLWSIFSSLPQPLMAVPAFLFVTMFEPLLPIGLGVAAGAMFYMVLFELLPESLESAKRGTVAFVFVLSMITMLLFQFLLT